MLQNLIYVYLIKKNAQTFNKSYLNIKIEVLRKIASEKITVRAFLSSTQKRKGCANNNCFTYIKDVEKLSLKFNVTSYEKSRCRFSLGLSSQHIVF